MQQIIKYSVTGLQTRNSNVLVGQDRELVDSYILENVPFHVDSGRLDVNIYDLNGVYMETSSDVNWYEVRGAMHYLEDILQIEVNPVDAMTKLGYPGDVIVEYETFEKLFSGEDLIISEISSDRTEIRAISMNMSSMELREGAVQTSKLLNNQAHFTGLYLDLGKEGKAVLLNCMTEVLEGKQVVTFKVYSPLPTTVTRLATFKVLRRLGEPARFSVARTVEIIPDEVPYLKGPNFDVDINNRSTQVSEYCTYEELLGMKMPGSFKDIGNKFDKLGIPISINHEKYEEFVHFSSAVERLENARYKFERVWDLQKQLDSPEIKADINRYLSLNETIRGILDSFDHYENYLYYESSSKAWPKESSSRPYVNVRDFREYTEWYENQIEEAERYDLQNDSILIGAIPFQIREDPNNEPYVMFVHMIGQHFDTIWMYAKAISDRYKADTRLDFGISKDLVKDAIESFGYSIHETNQNLEKLFGMCNEDGTYSPGEEQITDFERALPLGDPRQPVLARDYAKEVYKRIYHNIPLITKAKGTLRGLRVLINCFGIPDDILTVEVQGGISTERPFYSPEDRIEGNFKASGSNVYTDLTEKIRVGKKNEFIDDFIEGKVVRRPVLSRFNSTVTSSQDWTDDSHYVQVGFNLNKQVNEYIRGKLDPDFDINNLIGDPLNREEHYGDRYKELRSEIVDRVMNPSRSTRFRSPSAIIRLVRYFDVTLFRFLTDFLPARTSTAVGAVVEDNVLHRNRWKGIDLDLLDCTYTGSMTIGAITGSSGYSMQSPVPGLREGLEGCRVYDFDKVGIDLVSGGCPMPQHSLIGRSFRQEPWTVNYVTQSYTGTAIYDKLVFDDAPKYNGELSGSCIKVVHTWLTRDNEYHKSVQPIEDYELNFFFGGLPEPPYCKINGDSEYQYDLYVVDTPFTVSGSVVGQKAGTYIPLYVQHFKDSDVKEEFTAYSASYVKGGKGYKGWYRGLGNPGISIPDKDGKLDLLTIRPEYFIGKGYERDYTIPYSDLEGVRLCVQLDYIGGMPYYDYYGYDSVSSRVRDNYYYNYYYNYYSYYGNGDFLVTWKVLDKEGTELENDRAWPVLTDTNIRVSVEDSDGVYDIDVPLEAETMYGNTEGYKWMKLDVLQYGTGLHVKQYGVLDIGGYLGPFNQGNRFIDSDWYETHDIWYPNRKRWKVRVGVLGNIYTE